MNHIDINEKFGFILALLILAMLCAMMYRIYDQSQLRVKLKNLIEDREYSITLDGKEVPRDSINLLSDRYKPVDADDSQKTVAFITNESYIGLEEYDEEHVKWALKNGYSVYLDGQKADPKAIDVYDTATYKLKCNDEDKIIILTTKSQETVIPVFIPSFWK